MLQASRPMFGTPWNMETDRLTIPPTTLVLVSKHGSPRFDSTLATADLPAESRHETVSGRMPGPLVMGFDFAATVLFALEGAILAVGADFDLLGVIVAGFVTALGGGIIRDVLLGSTPPDALRFRRYAIAALMGGLTVFLLADLAEQIPTGALVALDAAGISAYMASGTRKALDFNSIAMTAVFLGTVTAVGGGVLRDLLLNRVPSILVTEVYATAAVAGAVVIVIGLHYRQPAARMMVAGAATCFALRMLSYYGDWNLPHP